ncbi:MAG TPA: hypothetical protein DF383_08175, partial [Deltaproteobacteria bacterium]|nr:hypothetical protein [Deltaproteobacteria bacterium]
STVHWKIVPNFKWPSEVKDSVFFVLESLEFYRVLAVLSFIWSILALRRKPIWLGWVSLPFALLAVGAALLVQ